MPVGVQLRRTRGWRMPTGAVSVARPTRWGNPYEVGSGQVVAHVPVAGPGAGLYRPGEWRRAEVVLRDGITAAEAVQLYRTDLVGNLEDPDPNFNELREALEQLRGRDLACWCQIGQPCHRTVLLVLANAPPGTPYSLRRFRGLAGSALLVGKDA